MPPPDALPAEPSPPVSADSELTVLIKSPTDGPGTPPFNLTLPRTASVRNAKNALAAQYPSRPPAASQRLIHAGKLLADSTLLADVLTGEPPQVIHLVAAPRSPVPRPRAFSPGVPQAEPREDAPGPPVDGYVAHIQEVEVAFARLLHHQERYFALVRAQPPAAPEIVAAELALVRAAIAECDASTHRQRDAIRVAAGAPPAAMPLHPHPMPFAPAGAAYQGPPGFQQLPGFQAMMYQAGINPPQPGPGAPPGAPGVAPHAAAPNEAFPPGMLQNGAFPAGAFPDGVNPFAVPGQQAPVWRRQFVFQFNFNWALLAKLAFFVFLLAQEGSPRRTKMLFVLALFIYLWQTDHLGFLRRLIAVILPSPNQLFVSLSSTASTRREAPILMHHLLMRKTAVVLSYLYSFVYGFVCSLLPSWNPEPLPPLFNFLTVRPTNGDGDRDGQGDGPPEGAANREMPPPDPVRLRNDAPREAGRVHDD